MHPKYYETLGQLSHLKFACLPCIDKPPSLCKEQTESTNGIERIERNCRQQVLYPAAALGGHSMVCTQLIAERYSLRCMFKESSPCHQQSKKTQTASSARSLKYSPSELTCAQHQRKNGSFHC